MRSRAYDTTWSLWAPEQQLKSGAPCLRWARPIMATIHKFSQLAWQRQQMLPLRREYRFLTRIIKGKLYEGAGPQGQTLHISFLINDINAHLSSLLDKIPPLQRPFISSWLVFGSLQVFTVFNYSCSPEKRWSVNIVWRKTCGKERKGLTQGTEKMK